MLNINFWNIAFTVINLLVLYLFLKHFLMKPLMEIMEKRQAQVETDLNDAASEKQEAIRLKEPLLSPSGEGPVEVQVSLKSAKTIKTRCSFPALTA